MEIPNLKVEASAFQARITFTRGDIEQIETLLRLNDNSISKVFSIIDSERDIDRAHVGFWLDIIEDVQTRKKGVSEWPCP